MNTQHRIKFSSDEFRLVGTLHMPPAVSPKVVIGCHGLLANRQSPKQISLAEACNRKGLAYFRFDHRGCGDSEGEFSAVTSLDARCRDLQWAIATIEANADTGPIACLFGSSFGGSVVLAHASSIVVPSVTAASGRV